MKDLSFPPRIWNPAECMDRKDLEALQLYRLKEAVARMSIVPMYQKKFKEAGVSVEDIKTLDDIRRLPFTTKQDLREGYPLDYIAVHRSEIARIHGSSGTTGKPTFMAYTQEDLRTWADLCSRFLVAGGLQPHHLVQISFGYGMFTGGFGLHYGVENVGAAVIPLAAGNTPRQVMSLMDLKPETLICTPSYATVIAEEVQRQGISPDELPLKYAHVGSEPWTEDMRHRIQDAMGIMVFDNWGLSEAFGPGVSGECVYQHGMHIQEDRFIVECLNPDTLEPVKPGELGELVITSLSRKAMSIIRYRTRDLAYILDEGPCKCGRTTKRMSRIKGRSDDMFIIRGVNVFPTQIEEALLRVKGTAPHYVIEIDRPGAMDEMTVNVEILPEYFSDKMSDMKEISQKIGDAIKSVTGVRAKLNLVQYATLERFLGKAKRVIDKRKLG